MIAKTLPTTLQGFFDNAWNHAVVEKNPRCVGHAGNCKYRGITPTDACLIGASIPNELYTFTMEQSSLGLVLEELFVAKNLVGPLRELQRVHDNLEIDYTKNIEAKLRRYAEEYNLTVPAST